MNIICHVSSAECVHDDSIYRGSNQPLCFLISIRKLDFKNLSGHYNLVFVSAFSIVVPLPLILIRIIPLLLQKAVSFG